MTLDLDPLRSGLHHRHDRVLIAAVAGGDTAHRTYGAPEAADAEIGSVSKGLTGLLYQDAVDRGEVTPETTLGEALDRPEGAYAQATLGSLATHASGLPPQPPYGGPRTMLRRTWRMWRHGENPYGDSVDQLLDEAADVRLGKPRFVYSNLGFALLGAALARTAGTSYERLLLARVAEPLGMTGVSVPSTPRCLGPTALTGRSKGGRPHEPWTGEAIGPAGGVRATAADLAALLGGLIERRAPGISALDPAADAPGASRIGAAWLTTRTGDASVTWHNGRTGGFASWVGVDRDAGVGLALVSATAASLDRDGFAGLARLRAEADRC
ncbi:serine hydrolase domain-containing protein [Demequina muriae]|uniref:Serine hydrolase domain-containing protein n=1 Tax=Demequina muriae TaxID=3051664 RepID=A0ABT8GG07_9MICO|nr:serine hydrolase domain-containing protein [Demequina sp. EGI L300058]MDN4479881.1 serine hydrolase domain-containing protein [Demequina sp. EGI L300058]